MKAAIVEINNIGRDLIIAETRRISDAVKRRLSLAYEIIPVDNAYRANGVTCFRVDEEEKLYHYLLDNKIVVGDGVGIHRGKLIRLGHMGWNLNVDALHKVVDMIIDRRKGKQNV
jgi:aspartate aminotransferase-like enzyme